VIGNVNLIEENCGILLRRSSASDGPKGDVKQVFTMFPLELMYICNSIWISGFEKAPCKI